MSASTRPSLQPARSPSSALPSELLNIIFDFLSPSNPTSVAFQMPPMTPLFVCSQVSQNWRLVAYPRLWNRVCLPCESYCLDRLERVVCFLNESCFNQHFPASYVRFLELSLETYCNHTTDLYEAIWRTMYVFNFFLDHQLEDLAIVAPAECIMNTHCHNTATLFSALAPHILHLPSLSIAGVFQHSPDALRAFQRCIPPTLHRLSLHDAEGEQIPWEDIFLSLPALDDLEITHATGLHAHQLAPALRRWGPQLQRFSLRYSPAANDDRVVVALTECCPKLVSLALGRGNRNIVGAPDSNVVTDMSLCALVDACPRIEELYLGQLHDITDGLLVHLEGAVRLRSLRLVECYGLGTSGVWDTERLEGLEKEGLRVRVLSFEESGVHIERVAKRVNNKI